VDLNNLKGANMIGLTTAACCQYELEIAINAPRERVWKAIFEETNFWWLPDFHVADAGSTMTFDPHPGGRGLVEDTADGGGLLWYSVQMFLPEQFKIYLIGHIAPEWGGPTTSSLKLAVEATPTGSVLKVTDARHGHIDEQHLQSYQDGWQQLFTDGLKRFVESKEIAG
jgi:uncharacterized protein YndB with AHSA1/START domain